MHSRAAVMSIDNLYALYKDERTLWTDQLRTRIHRSISWLRRAQATADDMDASFIFHWIAFNAAYSKVIEDEDANIDRKLNERSKYEDFIRCIQVTDRTQRLADLLFIELEDACENLIQNEFVLYEYWRNQQDPSTPIDWESVLSQQKLRASKFKRDGNVYEYLRILLSRAHVLRNQIIHGAATWNSSANRRQLKDAHAILRKLIPLMLELMIRDPDQDWGDVQFPLQ